MRRFMHTNLTIALLIVMSAWAHADSNAAHQDNNKEFPIQGYFFVAPTPVYNGHSVEYRGTTIHIGGGAEVLLYKGFGIGAEVGYVTAPKIGFFFLAAPRNGLYFAGTTDSGIGIFSANGSYSFLRNRKLSPFVTGGYSLGFREGHSNLLNLGAGATYWIKDRLGLRLEFRGYRNHIENTWSTYEASDYDTWILSGRIGLSLR